MNNPPRYESANSSIASEFPKWKQDVSREETTVSLSDALPSVGVLLNRHRQDTPNTSWLRVSHNKQEEYVSIDLLNPQIVRQSLGHSALIDTVRIGEGDRYIIGRHKYPELGGYVSGQHIAVSVDFQPGKSYLYLNDLGSTNGTGVYMTDARSARDGSGYYEEDYPTKPHNVYSEEKGQDNQMLAFIDKYKEDYKSMSDIDWAICFNVISDLRTRFANDRKGLERQFNKVLHPDRQIVADQKAVHDMYVIGKKEFGL